MDSISEKIIALSPTFTKKQMVLGKYINDNMLEVALMNAPNIAKKAGVSEATLTRFVYALGYQNFASFQLDIRKRAQEPKNSNPFRQEYIGEPDKNAFARVFGLEKTLMNEMMGMFDPVVFDTCVDKIMNADKVMIIGGSISDFLAQYMAIYLSVIRDDVITFRQLDLSFYGALESMTENSVAIVFSYPRYPKDTMKIVEAISMSNIPIITITDSNLSPMVKYSNYTIITPQRYLIFVPPISTAVTLIHAMLVAIYKKNTGVAKARLKKYEQLVLSTDMFEFKDYNFAEKLN